MVRIQQQRRRTEDLRVKTITAIAKAKALQSHIDWLEARGAINEEKTEGPAWGSPWRKNKNGSQPPKFRRWYAPGVWSYPVYEELLDPGTAAPSKKHEGITCEDRKWPRGLGRAVALELIERLEPYCQRIEVAGSIRRGKPMVGDVELLFVPKIRLKKASINASIVEVPETDAIIDTMLADGTLAKRLSSVRRTTWGPANKLAVHVGTGMAVDLFGTTTVAWWNALTCRTGGAETNKKLAQSAIANGRNWNVYGQGVTMADGTVIRAESEEHVFELCGVSFLRPDERT